MIHDEEAIRLYYKDEGLAQEYIAERFSKPLGRVQHLNQVETINDIIRFYHIDNILEVACGPARLTADIQGFKKGIAIDTSDQMLQIAQQRVREPDKWQFIDADIFHFNLSERFQLIYTFRFIRHFRFPERMNLYAAFHELLENRGIIIFDAVHYEKIPFVRNLENRGQKKIYDKIYQNTKALEDEMGLAGYEILELKGVIHHFYLQAAISRISNRFRMDRIGIKLIHSLERYPLGRPLEWTVICRKK